MRKSLSLILVWVILFSLMPSVTFAQDLVNDGVVTQFNTGDLYDVVEYKYDFDSFESTPTITNQPSNVTIEEYNGSKALKVTGKGSDGYFSIELPKAVKTKYALVKVKTTPVMNDGWANIVNAPAFKDSNGRKSVYIRYNYDKKVYSGHGEQNIGVPASGKAEEFEAVIDFTAQTFTYGENTKPFCEEAIDIKSIYFEFGNCNDIFYFDDIEITGFNDYSTIKPSEIVPANGATNISAFENEISIKYPIAVTEGFADSQNITIIKNGEELFRDTDYTVTGSGKKLVITLNEPAGVESEVKVFINDELITLFNTASADYIVSYKYDFESAEGTPVIKNQPSQVTVEEYNGSKALKVAPNGGMSSFSIELPEAVKTKYVLVKIKGTPATNDAIIYQASPSYRDSDGNEAMRFRYWYDKQIFYGSDASFTGSYSTTILSPYPKAGEPGEFEALMDLSSSTVSFGNDTAYFLNKVKDIKSLVFEFNGNSNATVYYDDIEIMGFNSHTVFDFISATPAIGEENVHIKSTIEMKYEADILYGNMLDDIKALIDVKKNGEFLPQDAYNLVCKDRSTMQIVFEGGMDYGGSYEVFYQGELVTSFKTKEITFNRSENFDFDTNTPKILNLKSEGGADMEIMQDTTAGNKALRVRVPKRSELSFDMDIGGTTADYAILTMRMRLESSRNDEGFWKSPYQNTSVGAPSIRDAMGREIARAYNYLMPSIRTLNTTRTALHWQEEDKDKYADYRVIIDFKSKTAIADIADRAGNWGNVGEGTFFDTNAEDVTLLHFDFKDTEFDESHATNITMWIDDITIREFDDLAITGIKPVADAENIGVNEPIKVTFSNRATSGMLKRFDVKIFAEDKELKPGEDYQIRYSGNNVDFIPIGGWKYSATYKISTSKGEQVFTTGGWQNERTTAYDFDTSFPEIVQHSITEGASIEIVKDETTGSNAIKVVRPANGRVAFSVNLPVTSADKVKIGYKLRIEELHSENNAQAFHDRLIAERHRQIPGIRDLSGKAIVYNHSAGGAKINFVKDGAQNTPELRVRTGFDPYYNVEQLIDFKKKITVSNAWADENRIQDIKLAFPDGVGSNVADLYFDYAGSDYDLIMYIDDIYITEIAGESFRIDSFIARGEDGMRLFNGIIEATGQTISLDVSVINELIEDRNGILIAQIIDKEKNLLLDIDHISVKANDEIATKTLQLSLPEMARPDGMEDEDYRKMYRKKYDIKVMLWSEFGGYRLSEPLSLIDN